MKENSVRKNFPWLKGRGVKFLGPKFPVAKFSAEKLSTTKFPVAKYPATKFIAAKISTGEISGSEIFRGKHGTKKISSFQPLQTLKCIILNISKVEISIIFVER